MTKITFLEIEQLKRVDGVGRILGFRNICDFTEIKRWKKKLKLFISVIPLNKKGRKLTLREIGIEPREYYKNQVIEQFNIYLTKKQAKTLLAQLKKALESNP